MILERFFPDIYIRSVFELPLEELKARGICGLVFDIDNTVAPFDVAEPEESIVELFAYLRREGFRLCILSNNSRERVHLFNTRLRTLAVHKAGLPALCTACARWRCIRRASPVSASCGARWKKWAQRPKQQP